MFNQNIVLIVEDQPVIALSLAIEVECLGGMVAGPCPTVARAFDIVASEAVTAAILDVKLADCDVTPLALQLARQGIPFVVHSATGLPGDLAAELPAIAVVPKPASPEQVVEQLLKEIAGK